MALTQVYLVLDLMDFPSWPVLLGLCAAGAVASQQAYGRLLTPLSVVVAAWTLSLLGADLLPLWFPQWAPPLAERWPIWYAVEGLCLYYVMFAVAVRFFPVGDQKNHRSEERTFVLLAGCFAVMIPVLVYVRLKAGMGLIGFNPNAEYNSMLGGETRTEGVSLLAQAVTFASPLLIGGYAFLVSYRRSGRSLIMLGLLAAMTLLLFTDRREYILVPAIGIICDLFSGSRTRMVVAVLLLVAILGMFTITQRLLSKEVGSGGRTVAVYTVMNWNAYSLGVSQIHEPGALGGRKTLQVPRGILRNFFQVPLDRLESDYEPIGRLEELDGFNTVPVAYTFYRDFGFSGIIVGLGVVGLMMGCLYGATRGNALAGTFYTAWLISHGAQTIRSNSTLEIEFLTLWTVGMLMAIGAMSVGVAKRVRKQRNQSAR